MNAIIRTVDINAGKTKGIESGNDKNVKSQMPELPGRTDRTRKAGGYYGNKSNG